MLTSDENNATRLICRRRALYTNILVGMEAWMPARAGKTSDRATTAARLRRGTRPRSATAAARIYQLLRGELISLQRKPGDLISEAEIALANGVSRTPVREAILKLA